MPHFGHIWIFNTKIRKPLSCPKSWAKLGITFPSLVYSPGWRGLYPVADFIIRTSIDSFTNIEHNLYTSMTRWVQNYNGLVQTLVKGISVTSLQVLIPTLEPDDWCDTDSMTSDSSDSSFFDSLATSDSDLESLKGKFHQLQTFVNGCT